MERREFVEKLGIGSAAALAATVIGRGTADAAGQHAHDARQIDGPLASVTVSFGQWLTDPPLDRFTNPGNTRTSNQHLLIPYNSRIKAGGSVNFVISGLHLLLIYAPGSTLGSINDTLVEFAVPGGFPGFVNDPANRVYRGLDPRPLPLDRVESVTFAEPGTYLVVCGILPHLQAGMAGFVNVIR